MHKSLSYLSLLVSALILAACGKQPEPQDQATAGESPAGMALDDYELMERDLFFDNPTRTQGRISPDGSSMSFMAPLDGVLNLWVGPLGDFDAVKPITDDKLRGIAGHQWALDGKHLMYMRDQGGNEDFHIISVNKDSGETVDLTPFENTRGIFVGGSYRHPDEYLLGINNRDPRWHDVWRVNVATGDKELVVQHDRFAQLVADLDLEVRLAIEPTEDGGNLVLKRDEAGDWVEFFKIEKEDGLTTNILGFTEAGTHFLMLDSAGRDTSALVLVDYATDERTVIAENDQADVVEVLVDPVTNEPMAYAVDYTRKQWFAIDTEIQGELDRMAGSMPGNLSVLGQTRDNRQWIVASDAARDPLTYFVLNRETGAVNELFASRPALEGKPLNEMHPVVIKSRDGLDLVSYVTLPPHVDPDGDGRPAAPVPMVLTVHGGPWARDEYGYGSWAQWLSNRGFATLSVNYRGSTGFGKAFLNAGNKEWAAAMHDDLIDAVDWAVAEGIAIEDKVAIAGGSYGGYATLVGVTFTPDKFACGVDIVGPSNLVTLLNSIPPYWASFLETFALRVGDPRTEEGRAFLRSRSPLFLADRIKKPLLIGQGANDPRVKQPEADQIVSAMSDKGLPVTYVLYPDEGHGFARPENRDSFYAIMEAFLANCLGGRSQPFGDAFDGSSTQVPHGAGFVPGLEEALRGFEPVIKN